MRFNETNFEEYVKSCKKTNLHPYVSEIRASLPQFIHKSPNILFYGPAGVGKYSQCLLWISEISGSPLKYNKKLFINYNKHEYVFRISDTHVEIDMSLLGCASKMLWNDIYNQLVNITAAKSSKTLIILCTNFHAIHNELLEVFDSYLQRSSKFTIRFYIISEHISFIGQNILNKFMLIPVSRPTKTMYNKCIPKTRKVACVNMIGNIKEIPFVPEKHLMELLNIIRSPTIDLLLLREEIYNLFIYDSSIPETIWTLLETLLCECSCEGKQMDELLLDVLKFYQYYNNNYRPIYHLERIILTLVKVVNSDVQPRL